MTNADDTQKLILLAIKRTSDHFDALEGKLLKRFDAVDQRLLNVEKGQSNLFQQMKDCKTMMESPPSKAQKLFQSFTPVLKKGATLTYLRHFPRVYATYPKYKEELKSMVSETFPGEDPLITDIILRDHVQKFIDELRGNTIKKETESFRPPLCQRLGKWKAIPQDSRTIDDEFVMTTVVDVLVKYLADFSIASQLKEALRGNIQPWKDVFHSYEQFQGRYWDPKDLIEGWKKAQENPATDHSPVPDNYSEAEPSTPPAPTRTQNF